MPLVAADDEARTDPYSGFTDGDTGGAALTASESPSVDVASASLLGLLAMSTVMEAQVNEVCGPRATVSAMPIRVGIV